MKNLFTSLFLLIATAIGSAGAYGFEYDGMYFNIISSDDRTCEIVSGNTPYSGDIVIPSSVPYHNSTLSVTAIGSEAFYGADVTSVVIPNSVTEIGYSAFQGCSLTSIDIPNSVTYIGNQAFLGCSLTSIDIPNSVTYIGNQAFGYCIDLNTVHIIGGGDCEPLSWRVFYNGGPWFDCYNLKNLIIDRELDPSELFLNNREYTWILMFSGEDFSPSIQNITIGCKTLPSNAIQNYTGLETITFTGYVDVIEENALKGCSGLKAIYCQSLAPPLLGTGSFTSEQLIELPIYVPNGSIAAYKAAPEWCNFWNFQEYEVPFGEHSQFKVEGITYRVLDLDKHTCAVMASYPPYAGDVVIPESVEYDNYTFDVTTIGDAAFAYCTSLASIVIPNSVNTIRPRAFAYCENLTSVRFAGGDNKTPITWWLFERVGNNYNFLSPWLGCSSLTDLTIEREIDTNKGTQWFEDANSSKWLYMFFTEFENYTAYEITLENLTFGCTAMPSWGINGCTDLQTITFTDAVEKIEAGALEGCSGLKSITCKAITPPELGTGSFTVEQYKNLPVYVPSLSLADYQAAPVWRLFQQLQGDIQKIAQEITWDQDFSDICEEDVVELTAVASSGLPVVYEITEGADCAELNGNMLKCIQAGSITITATQPGNDEYEAADPVTKTIIIKQMSGIDDVNNEKTVVSIIGKMLNVKGLADGQSYMVHSASGMLIYNGCDSSLSLTSGVYIVTIPDNKPMRIVVR